MSTFQRHKYEDNIRAPILKLIPPNVETLLDVGCNYGGFGAALKMTQEVEVWGVEPDTEASKIAKEKLDHLIEDEFHSGNALPDGYFDIITFNDSLEHMNDPADALKLCKLKLKPDGRIICCVPNMRHIENLEHLIFDKDWKYEEQGVRDRTHLRFFTEKSITCLFEELGFEVIDLKRINESWWEKKRIFRRLFFMLFKKFTLDMKHIQVVVIAKLK